LDSIKKIVEHSLQESIAAHQALQDAVGHDIARAAEMLIRCVEGGGKVLLFGNGGSAADAQHIAAEFTGRFVRERRPLPAIALTTDTSALTAIGNDYGYDQVFERQVRALAAPGDLAIAISTSGNSPSVLNAVSACRELGVATIALTGASGGKLLGACDVTIRIPCPTTARVQECHLLIEHILCEAIDQRFAPNEVTS
jgi:D-sedoheptulose 7-phosphate isomerase